MDDATGESEVMMDFSIVIPAKNEAVGLSSLLPELRERYPTIPIILVDDGSDDNTREIAESYGCEVKTHRRSLGNGAAIKTGVRSVTTEFVLMLDADGQHPPVYIDALIKQVEAGADLVVGARRQHTQASVFRGMANRIYNGLASWMTGYDIKDLTSGFRIVRTDLIKSFLYLLPNKFSYPTTSTMAAIRSGAVVEYVDIDARKREGKSHIRVFRDGIRFFLIIFKIATLYSPLKIFIPIAGVFFSVGFVYFLYTITFLGRFTNMSALLISVATLVFLIGLVSEQITALMYRDSNR